MISSILLANCEFSWINLDILKQEFKIVWSFLPSTVHLHKNSNDKDNLSLVQRSMCLKKLIIPQSKSLAWYIEMKILKLRLPWHETLIECSWTWCRGQLQFFHFWMLDFLCQFSMRRMEVFRSGAISSVIGNPRCFGGVGSCQLYFPMLADYW